MIQNTDVNEVGNQAPTSTSTDAITNADNPIDKAAGQVCESESSIQQTCPTLLLEHTIALLNIFWLHIVSQHKVCTHSVSSLCFTHPNMRFNTAT